ncbi:amidase [Blastochloris sulfoviridis]|uniref:Amidase n=1 Tax=Blastochloris sulfoviridis TaxID=50712 RepID=A0A5M6HJV1_9HYPH|nr:amidase [Blastochloris sulfoviridis]KAA5595919.1 amidase [Blastochloris sulfoviridis]
MTLDAHLLAPAHVLLDRLAAGEVSAADLTEAALARIGALDGRLNAVVTRDPEGARAAARRSDARRAEGRAGPLEGLPITIKDAFAVKGMRSTGGVPALSAYVPDDDAVAVARLRAAGAVILGKTNVPPYSGDFVANNPIFGRTSNPWDLDRSPGGSSGGAAVAVACGFSAFELGSDLGGSIRWPAHACGLFGLKTSFGVVPLAGIVPPASPDLPELDLWALGPLARSARDLERVLDVLAPPGDRRGAFVLDLPEPRQRDGRGLRIALWDADGFAPVDSSVAHAIAVAAGKLAEAGAVINIARPAVSLDECYEIYAILNAAQFTAELPELIRRRLAARASDTAADDVSHPALQTRGVVLSFRDWLMLTARRQAMKRAWAAFFADYDAILLPPAPVGAVPHPATDDLTKRTLSVDGTERPWLDFLLWSSLASLAHLPAAVAPVERGPDGLPRGVQIVCAEGHDRMAVAIAALLEERGSTFVPPPLAA